MIILKSPSEIDLMRRAGEIVFGCLDLGRTMMKPGVRPIEVDRAVEEYIRAQGATPSFKGYMGYTASTCISVNEEVVHGIPGTRPFKDGDIVGLDIGAIWRGYHGDAARTFAIGDVPERTRQLLTVTRESLEKGIEQAREGNRLSDISHAIQKHAEAAGFSVVRNLVGHGIGQDLHEKPQVPNYGPPGMGPKLKVGMVLALEPMVNIGGQDVYTKPDRWTIVTADGSLSAHFEQTVAITENGPEVLTGMLHTGLERGAVV